METESESDKAAGAAGAPSAPSAAGAASLPPLDQRGTRIINFATGIITPDFFPGKDINVELRKVACQFKEDYLLLHNPNGIKKNSFLKDASSYWDIMKPMYRWVTPCLQNSYMQDYLVDDQIPHMQSIYVTLRAQMEDTNNGAIGYSRNFWRSTAEKVLTQEERDEGGNLPNKCARRFFILVLQALNGIRKVYPDVYIQCFATLLHKSLKNFQPSGVYGYSLFADDKYKAPGVAAESDTESDASSSDAAGSPQINKEDLDDPVYGNLDEAVP
jgi:hypothetical protein